MNSVGRGFRKGQAERLGAWLEENRARPRPGARWIRTTLRTLHILAFAALFGGHVFDVPPERLGAAFAAAWVSGVLFMAFEVWRTPIWLIQLRGIATFAKLGLLLLLAVEPPWATRVALLALVATIGSVVSHMPGRLRYYSLLHGRALGEPEKG
jgi:hypothetical protein